jgi:hypothetical protein
MKGTGQRISRAQWIRAEREREERRQYGDPEPAVICEYHARQVVKPGATRCPVCEDLGAYADKAVAQALWDEARRNRKARR